MDSSRQVAVFLTAIPAEYDAVRAFIAEPEEVEHKGTLFERGHFESEDRVPWDVVVAELGEGTENAAAITERAIEHFKASHVFFVGVAGGIKDVRLGDVVGATKVYGYESGKAESTFKPRPDLGHATYAMAQRARSVSRQGHWVRRIQTRQSADEPKSLVKPIASGNKVVADTRSAIFKFIRAQYGDAVAVEMEGIGFFKAVNANTGIEAIEIRGISDLIDHKAQSDEDGWQPRAAAHAAAFAFEMLARMGQPKQQIETFCGTQIPVTDFDRTIEQNLREIFMDPGLDLLGQALLAEAVAREPPIAASDPADLLCAADLQLDHAIAWLTKAVRENLKRLHRQTSLDRGVLSRELREILGWLVLRAVDQRWLRDNGNALFFSPR